LAVKVFPSDSRAPSDAAGHACLKTPGGTDECALSVELSQSNRVELMQLLSAGKQAARKPAAQPSLKALS
jgi:hypothetical protein